MENDDILYLYCTVTRRTPARDAKLAGAPSWPPVPPLKMPPGIYCARNGNTKQEGTFIMVGNDYDYDAD